MRKIEQDMLRAIANRTNWKCGNTEVRCPFYDTQHVYLHGHHIAEIFHGKPTANRQTLARWPTPTTKSRLRALGINVYTKNFTTYLDDEEV